MKNRKETNPANECLLAHMDELVPIIEERLSANGTVKLSPTGISMLPMLRQGIDCVILSSPPSRLKKYDIPLYRRANGQYVLHRVTHVSGDSYTCIGDNQFNYEKGIAHESVIAVVTAFTRGEKTYTVKYLPYRVYCVLWHFTRFFRHVYRALKRRALRLFSKKHK